MRSVQLGSSYDENVMDIEEYFSSESSESSESRRMMSTFLKESRSGEILDE